MSPRKLALPLFVALCLAALGWAASDGATPEPQGPAEDGTLPALTAIAGQGMMHSHAYQNLQDLSDNIGGRVTSSPAAQRAIEWGADKMKALGLENVHTETWQMRRGWTRISADAEILSPAHHALMIDSLGWVGSTPTRGIDADVAPVNLYRLDEETKENAANWAGKALLIWTKGEPPKDRLTVFGKFGPFLNAAYAAHAVAVIGGQGGGKAAGMHLTHTGGIGFDTWYDIPVVSMAAEDQDQIERFLDQKRPVRIHIDVQNRFTDGPVDSANVVGEIRGTQAPGQIVVVGAHLDSWDLAEGATDNGVGTVCVLGAAEAIMASGFKPKRTVRFVLFTGEEEGLLGSLAYTKTHKAEMPDHVAAVVLDNGQGYVTRLNLGGREDLIPAVKRFAEAVKAFGDIGVDDGLMFGTDTGPFSLEGLPGINMGQDSPEYRYTHHSVVDTFDHVEAEKLLQDETLMALTAFWIADRPERLASPWPPEKTARMLVDKHEDQFLKQFNLWPFGDLGQEKGEKKGSAGPDGN